MRAGVRAAASASINRKGKQRERYADDPEEEATLLGDASHEDGEYEHDEQEQEGVRREPSAQVCVSLALAARRVQCMRGSRSYSRVRPGLCD